MNETRTEASAISVYKIRGKEVVLDSGVAKIYNLETKRINEVVRNNINNFNENISWILSDEENLDLRSKIPTSSWSTYGGRRYNHRVFTKEGIKILASQLKAKAPTIATDKILSSFSDDLEFPTLSNTLILREENIKNMIYEIRGMRVILDSDIAKLFLYDTKNLNRQVLRNWERFPENYCFQLTKEEYQNSLRCQNGTLNDKGRGAHSKYLPYAFTEYGVIMLAGLLKSKIAVEASIRIVNTFIEMRKIISEELLESRFYKNLILKHDEEIQKLNIALKNLETKDQNTKIFFNGEIYDAYSKIIDIMLLATHKLIVIDSYADKNFLDMIRNLKIEVTLITKKIIF